ncbi:hypothetical protein [Pseudonocardia sp. TRM90224]|uniref:hypothetical protein n=1 Tax=Pseudonocardia sp. TRM90224 TaxID=2812678 RepID=UPI001E3F3267|nr:hypothetical protein [Pseudonocardia sp. TRM90224]
MTRHRFAGAPLQRRMLASVLGVVSVSVLVSVFVSRVDARKPVEPNGFDLVISEPASDDPLPRSLTRDTSRDGAGRTMLYNGAGSPWVGRIAPDAAVDPASDTYVRGFASDEFVLSHKVWTVPIYHADAGTPRRNVPLTAEWALVDALPNVPVPPDARPDPMDDAQLAIVDSSTGCVYDFWGASGTGSGLTAQWGNAMPVEGSGVYPDGLGSRASGISAAAGVITADELRRGSIEHALAFAYPKTKAGGPVPPATKSDGTSTDPSALPEGARVRLDPAVDVTKLGLNRTELAIARALQRYGMILVDTSGGFTIYVQHPQSLPAGTYAGVLPDTDWMDLGKIPVDRFQVMDLPAQTTDRSGLIRNRCNKF